MNEIVAVHGDTFDTKRGDPRVGVRNVKRVFASLMIIHVTNVHITHASDAVLVAGICDSGSRTLMLCFPY